MLTHEWRELEVLCERISDLRHRHLAAQRTKNTGLIEGLKDDLKRARRQREMLVHHISACLSTAAAAHHPSSDVDDDRRRRSEPTAAQDGDAAVMFGFDRD